MFAVDISINLIVKVEDSPELTDLLAAVRDNRYPLSEVLTKLSEYKQAQGRVFINRVEGTHL